MIILSGNDTYFSTKKIQFRILHSDYSILMICDIMTQVVVFGGLSYETVITHLLRSVFHKMH